MLTKTGEIPRNGSPCLEFVNQSINPHSPLTQRSLNIKANPPPQKKTCEPTDLRIWFCGWGCGVICGGVATEPFRRRKPTTVESPYRGWSGRERVRIGGRGGGISEGLRVGEIQSGGREVGGAGEGAGEDQNRAAFATLEGGRGIWRTPTHPPRSGDPGRSHPKGRHCGPVNRNERERGMRGRQIKEHGKGGIRLCKKKHLLPTFVSPARLPTVR